MFSSDHIKPYSKALVLGTGGGNDIVSALIPALHLQKHGIQTDIAGMLSPGAVHLFSREYESCVNNLSGEVTRYIGSKRPAKLSFVDAVLPEIARSAGVDVGNYYNFSTRFGTEKLRAYVQQLIKQNGYDLLVAVDLGGDVLARGAEDSTLLSPLMDFTTLELIRTLDIDSVLVEFGLGTDGELRPDGMRQIVDQISSNGMLLREDKLVRNDPEIKLFRQVFAETKKVRAGNTGGMTLATLDTPTPYENIVAEYTFRSQIGGQEWYTPFPVTIPYAYFGKTYTLDAKQLIAKRPQTVFSHENLLEQLIKVKTMQPNRKTELDLFYLWSGNNWTTAAQKGYCLHCLTPSFMISAEQRSQILAAGLDELRATRTDLALVLQADLPELDTKGVQVEEVGKFALLLNDTKNRRFITETMRKIIAYQK